MNDFQFTKAEALAWLKRAFDIWDAYHAIGRFSAPETLGRAVDIVQAAKTVETFEQCDLSSLMLTDKRKADAEELLARIPADNFIPAVIAMARLRAQTKRYKQKKPYVHQPVQPVQLIQPVQPVQPIQPVSTDPTNSTSSTNSTDSTDSTN